MKKTPPCRGLWSPCGRRSRAATRGDPSGQRPGPSSCAVDPGHVQKSDTVIGTSARLQIGHVPACGSATLVWTGHDQEDSRRTGSSFILQIGQVPAWSFTTSGCIGQVHERGGTGSAGLKACITSADSEKTTGRSRKPTERHYKWWSNRPRMLARQKTTLKPMTMWRRISSLAVLIQGAA